MAAEQSAAGDQADHHDNRPRSVPNAVADVAAAAGLNAQPVATALATVAGRNRLRRTLFHSRVAVAFAATGGVIRDVTGLRKGLDTLGVLMPDDTIAALVEARTAAGPVARHMAGMPFARRMEHADFVAFCEALLAREEAEDTAASADTRERQLAFAAVLQLADGAADGESGGDDELGESAIPALASSMAPERTGGVRFAVDTGRNPENASGVDAAAETSGSNVAPLLGWTAPSAMSSSVAASEALLRRGVRLDHLEAFFERLGLPPPPRLAHIRQQREAEREATIDRAKAEARRQRPSNASSAARLGRSMAASQRGDCNSPSRGGGSRGNSPDAAIEASVPLVGESLVRWDEFAPLLQGRARALGDGDESVAGSRAGQSMRSRRSVAASLAAKSSAAAGASPAATAVSDGAPHSPVSPTIGSGDYMWEQSAGDLMDNASMLGMSALHDESSAGFGMRSRGYYGSEGDFGLGLSPTPALDAADPDGAELRHTVAAMHDVAHHYRLPPIPRELRQPKPVRRPAYMRSEPAGLTAVGSGGVSSAGDRDGDETPPRTGPERRALQMQLLGRLSGTGPRAYRDDDPASPEPPSRAEARAARKDREREERRRAKEEEESTVAPVSFTLASVDPDVLARLGVRGPSDVANGDSHAASTSLCTDSVAAARARKAAAKAAAAKEAKRRQREQSSVDANAQLSRIFSSASTLGFLNASEPQVRRDRERWRKNVALLSAEVHGDDVRRPAGNASWNPTTTADPIPKLRPVTTELPAKPRPKRRSGAQTPKQSRRSATPG